MDLGFEGGFTVYGQKYSRNPFSTVYANDISEPACATLAKNFHVTPHVGSIADVDFASLSHTDVVTGGFPCQTFSHAGKREGLDSERGQLYKQMKNVIEAVRPKIFVAENVDGLRTSKSANDTSALDIIVDEFRDSGYDVTYQVLKAVDYGVPQTRVRIIIIGVDQAYQVQDILYPASTHGGEGQPAVRTAEDGIEDLWEYYTDDTVMNHGVRNTSQAKFYPGRTMQGNNLISADRPSPTIRAEHHGNIEGHYRTLDGRKVAEDYSNVRRLSVRECARLQSFPDSFLFPVSASSAYRQIGNAVPPVLAWHIAQGVGQMLDSFTLPEHQ